MKMRHTIVMLALWVGCGGDAAPPEAPAPAPLQQPPAPDPMGPDAGADAAPAPDAAAPLDAQPAPDAAATLDAQPAPDASGSGCYDPEGTEQDIVEVTFVGVWNEHEGFDPSGAGLETLCPPAPQVGQQWGFGLPYDSCDDLWVRFTDEDGRCEFSESLTTCPGENLSAFFELQFDGGWEGSVDLEFLDPGDFVVGRDWCRYTVRTAP